MVALMVGPHTIPLTMGSAMRAPPGTAMVGSGFPSWRCAVNAKVDLNGRASEASTLRAVGLVTAGEAEVADRSRDRVVIEKSMLKV